MKQKITNVFKSLICLWLNFASYSLHGSLKVPAWDRNHERAFPKEFRRYRGIVTKRRDIAVIERVRTLVCLVARTDRGWVHRPRRQLIIPRVRRERERESRKSVKPPRMVNCGMRMVNCRPRVTKHARRKITFFTEVRAPVRERNESEVVYADYIVLPRLTCRLCYRRRIPAPRVRTLCTFVTVSFLLWAGASAYIIVLEGERMYVRLPRPLSCLSFFLPGRISMPTRDVGVQTRKGAGEDAEREKEREGVP